MTAARWSSTARAVAGSPAGVGFILTSAAGFSLQGTFTRFAYRALATPLTIGVGRFGITALVLWSYLLVRNRSVLRVPASTAAMLLSLGAVAYFLMSLTYTVAVMYIPVALASFIGYLYPMLATLIAVRLGHDRMTPRLGVGLVVTVAGLGVMLGGPILTAHHAVDWRGVLCMVGNAVAVALYIVSSDRILLRVHTVTAMAYIATGAALSNALVGVVTGTLFAHIDAHAWLWIAGIALFSTSLASACQLAALRRLGPARTATLSTLEALFTLGVATVFLRERLGVLQLVGGLIIWIGSIAVIQESRPVVMTTDLHEGAYGRRNENDV
jgi:drug/metabolite transporter (DMT)-like permease